MTITTVHINSGDWKDLILRSDRFQEVFHWIRDVEARAAAFVPEVNLEQLPTNTVVLLVIRSLYKLITYHEPSDQGTQQSYLMSVIEYQLCLDQVTRVLNLSEAMQIRLYRHGFGKGFIRRRLYDRLDLEQENLETIKKAIIDITRAEDTLISHKFEILEDSTVRTFLTSKDRDKLLADHCCFVCGSKGHGKMECQAMKRQTGMNKKGAKQGPDMVEKLTTKDGSDIKDINPYTMLNLKEFELCDVEDELIYELPLAIKEWRIYFKANVKAGPLNSLECQIDPGADRSFVNEKFVANLKNYIRRLHHPIKFKNSNGSIDLITLTAFIPLTFEQGAPFQDMVVFVTPMTPAGDFVLIGLRDTQHYVISLTTPPVITYNKLIRDELTADPIDIPTPNITRTFEKGTMPRSIPHRHTRGGQHNVPYESDRVLSDTKKAFVKSELDKYEAIRIYVKDATIQKEEATLITVAESSPGVFRMFEYILEKEGLTEFFMNYIDDCIEAATTLEELYLNTCKFLKVCRKLHIKLNAKKCEIRFPKTHILGRVVTKDSVKVDMKRLAPLRDAVFPFTMSMLQSFLGFAQWLAPFIPNYTDVVALLWELLTSTRRRALDKGKGSKHTLVQHTTSTEEAFNKVIMVLLTPAILAQPIPGATIVIHLDTCEYGIREFDYVIVFQLGKQNFISDYFLRSFPLKKGEQYISWQPGKVVESHLMEIAEEEDIKTFLVDMIGDNGYGYKDRDDVIEAVRASIENLPYELVDNVIVLNERPSMEVLVRLFVLGHSHPMVGHGGVQRMMCHILAAIKWPGMDGDVARMVRECPACQKEHAKHPHSVDMGTTVAHNPFDSVFLDYIGPFQESRGCKYILVMIDRDGAKEFMAGAFAEMCREVLGKEIEATYRARAKGQIDFVVSDYVLVHFERKTKLGFSWKGPEIVILQDHHLIYTTESLIDHVQSKVHVNRLHQFWPGTLSLEELTAKAVNENEYLVEKIYTHKCQGTKLYFWLKYLGYPDVDDDHPDTWNEYQDVRWSPVVQEYMSTEEATDPKGVG
eukprot:m51a1_g14449 hypothetical protein (1040) ;mRNA; r:607648-612250